MSWELTRYVLTLRNLTPTEKAVAHCLACHAPKHGSAYPSMETIAIESGLGNRTAAQKVVRRLEAKGVISPTTSKKGGRRNPTHYQFNTVNSIPADALYGNGNSIPRDSSCTETASLETVNSIPTDARDRRDKEAADSTAPATAVSKEQMGAELEIVWNYYVEAFDKQEIISPSANKSGIAVLTELRRRFHEISSEQCIDAMTAAIDRARHLAKTNPKKPFFSKWHAIFGKFDTFFSLWEEAD